MPEVFREELMPAFRCLESKPLPPAEKLGAYEQVRLDLDAPLADRSEMRQKLGIDGSLTATVTAAGKEFLVVDCREGGGNRDFYVLDDSFSPTSQEKRGFKGVVKDIPITIGRAHYPDRFDYPATVSRNHFKVAYKDGNLLIANLRPTNGTSLTAHLKLEDNQIKPRERRMYDDRTVNVEDRIRFHPNFVKADEAAPYGYYMNYPVIGRRSNSVDGGVYLGGSAREAVVVDGKSELLKKTYAELADKLYESDHQDQTLKIDMMLSTVMHKVQQVMPYDADKSGIIDEEHYGDKLVGLSTYLQEGAGVCRHQALLAAYFTEKLINDGFIDGSVAVERNTVEDLGGTHAWAVYKDRSYAIKEPIVIDPAQSFVGTKARAQKQGRWEYRLSTDRY